MLNSAEHEILNAYKYKKYKEIQLFSGSNKRRMLFFLLINVKMSKIVGILTFMSRKISCSAEFSMIFITSGPDRKINVKVNGYTFKEAAKSFSVLPPIRMEAVPLTAFFKRLPQFGRIEYSSKTKQS